MPKNARNSVTFVGLRAFTLSGSGPQVFHLLLGEFAFAPLESQSELFQPLQYSVQSLQVLFSGSAGHLRFIQVDDHALDALQNLFHTLLEEAWSRGHAKGEMQVPLEPFVCVDGE